MDGLRDTMNSKKQAGVKRSAFTFYYCYPSKRNVHAKSTPIKYYLEKIKLYVAIGFVTKVNIVCCKQELKTSFDKKKTFHLTMTRTIKSLR